MSVTVIVGLKVPATVGIPVNRPPALIASPGGSPVADQEKGVVPPWARTVVAGYVAFTTPFGNDAVVIPIVPVTVSVTGMT